jgi:hypothetical protein
LNINSIPDGEWLGPDKLAKAWNYNDGRSAGDRQAEIGQDNKPTAPKNATLIKDGGRFPCIE